MASSPSIETVRRFVNTVDPDEGVDHLATPLELRDWLAENGLMAPGAGAGPEDLATALELRDALRSIGAAHNDGTTDRAAIEAVNRIAAGLPVAINLDFEGGARFEAQTEDPPGALAGLMAIVFASALEGSWQRFKVCRNDECRWAFYDTSKNQSKRWCTMEDCGNAVNARAYRSRQRRRDASAGSAD